MPRRRNAAAGKADEGEARVELFLLRFIAAHASSGRCSREGKSAEFDLLAKSFANLMRMWVWVED